MMELEQDSRVATAGPNVAAGTVRVQIGSCSGFQRLCFVVGIDDLLCVLGPLWWCLEKTEFCESFEFGTCELLVAHAQREANLAPVTG